MNIQRLMKFGIFGAGLLTGAVATRMVDKNIGVHLGLKKVLNEVKGVREDIKNLNTDNLKGAPSVDKFELLAKKTESD